MSLTWGDAERMLIPRSDLFRVYKHLHELFIPLAAQRHKTRRPSPLYTSREPSDRYEMLESMCRYRPTDTALACFL